MDTQRIAPEHPHWPLVFMLVLTQLAAGAITTLWVMDMLGHAATLASVLAAAALAGISLGAATLHLGRPAYAWRALRGLRRSWLSREVLGLSLFAGSAAGYAGLALLDLPGRSAAGMSAVLFACIGTLCSARIYMVPARPAWNSRYTIAQFFSTALLLGPLFVAAMNAGGAGHQWLTRAIIGGATVQLLNVALKFLWLARSEVLELRASALLLSGRLKNVFLLRLALLLGGGVVLPLATHSISGAFAALALALAGEIAGRWLFFVSVVPKNIASAFLAAERTL